MNPPAQTPAPTGWNTWDVTTHTGMVHLPSGLRVRFGVLGPDGPVLDGFTWRDGLVRLGHHTVDGSSAEVTVSAADTTVALTMAGGSAPTLHAHVARTAGDAPLVVALDEWSPTPPLPRCNRHAAPPHDRGLRPPGLPDGGAAGRYLQVGGITWRVDVSPLPPEVRGAEPSRGGLTLVHPGPTVTVRIAPADAVPAALTEPAAASGPRLESGGWLGEAAAAATRAVTWNTVYVPDLDRVLTPTSRDFVSVDRRGFYGTWALHAWDTFFTGLAASVIDRDYARGVFEQILPFAVGESGMIPNRVSDDRGRTDDRSQPPVGALTVFRAYLAGGLCDATRDHALLARTFPALLAWHDWWPRARRGPHGLLAYGSDPVPGDAESGSLDRAKRESGLDDSPMYDEAAYDPATHTMDLADVGLNALHIADAEALAGIADRLGAGEAATAARLRAEVDRARAAADRLLWDPERAGYRNLRASGEHDPHLSPTLLYPLLAGLPTPDRAAAFAAELLSPEALGGDRPLPSVARNDPGFAATYWRGRIWAPMAYLAVEGLRRYGLTALSRPVVDALLRLFLAEWEAHSHVRENYPAHAGEDIRTFQARSDGLMAWGGLLAHLAFAELADARPDGWRFAHPGRPADLVGLPLGEGRLAVRATERRLGVELDGRPLLDASSGVTVRGYRRTADRVTGVAEGHGDLLITPPAGEPVRLAVDGTPRPFDLGRQPGHRP
ncbi:trehalase family glycosidase [Streptomyces sp. B6B3]|uniref:MGH1-like glycoside hydrolase domain-containing protein n=1 Tax=Streptomyces sp. B6B3 TaxID=3153570 RepID=UPI00325E1A7B